MMEVREIDKSLLSLYVYNEISSGANLQILLLEFICEQNY